MGVSFVPYDKTSDGGLTSSSLSRSHSILRCLQRMTLTVEKKLVHKWSNYVWKLVKVISSKIVKHGQINNQTTSPSENLKELSDKSDFSDLS